MHNCILRRCIFTRSIFFGLVFAAAALLAHGERLYTIDARVYCIKPNPSGDSRTRLVNAKADMLELSGQPDVFYMEGDGEIDVSGIVLYIKDGDVAWKTPQRDSSSGVKSEGSDQSEEPDSNRVITIARPSLVTPAGKESKIEIVQPVQSFTRRDDGPFELQAHGKAGVTIECKVAESKESGRVTLDWKCTNKRVTGRKEIPGVSLPIGEPTVATETTQQRANVKLGDWSGIFQVIPDGNVTVNLVRVSKSRGGSK